MKQIKLSDPQINVIKQALSEYYGSNEAAIDGGKEYISEIKSNSDMKEDIKREKALIAELSRRQKEIARIMDKLA